MKLNKKRVEKVLMVSATWLMLSFVFLYFVAEHKPMFFSGSTATVAWSVSMVVVALLAVGLIMSGVVLVFAGGVILAIICSILVAPFQWITKPEDPEDEEWDMLPKLEMERRIRKMMKRELGYHSYLTVKCQKIKSSVVGDKRKYVTFKVKVPLRAFNYLKEHKTKEVEDA